MAETLAVRVNELEPQQSAKDLPTMLTALEASGLSSNVKALEGKGKPSVLPLVGESITIVRVTPTDRESGSGATA